MKYITSLDTFRFIAAIFIVLLHTRTFFFGKDLYFSCGSLAVELFFVLSGFLLANTYQKLKQKKRKPLSKEYLCQAFFFRRFLRLWPEYIFAMFVSMILLGMFTKTTTQPFFLNFFMMAGVGGIPAILTASWYVPVVFLCSYLLFCLLICSKESSKTLIFPILFFLCLFFMINTKNPFRNPTGVIQYSLLSRGMIRGLLAMIVGIYTFWICNGLAQYSKKLNKRLTPIVLFIGEVISVGSIFYTLTFQRNHGISDFNIYFYSAFLIGLLYYKKEKLLKFLSWKIWIPFSTISYSLYLTQWTSLTILKKICPYFIKENIARGYIVSLLFSMLFAACAHYVFIWLRSKIRKFV